MAGCDYVDMSLVDGYTLPFKLDIIGACTGKNLQQVHVIDCSGLTFGHCPAGERLGPVTTSLQAINPHTGLVSGCYGPCMKLIDPKWNNTGARGHHAQEPAIAPYCCTTPPVTPEQCTAGPIGTTAYVAGVHAMCPGVYGYSYDDGTGLMRCQAGTEYQLTFFCPSVLPRRPTGWAHGASFRQPAFHPAPPGPPVPARPAAPAQLPVVHKLPLSPTTALPPATSPCSLGGKAICPGTGATCTGNQCCPDDSTCPSADLTFRGCKKGKTATCRPPVGVPAVVTPKPTAPSISAPTPTPVHAAKACLLGEKVLCPGTGGECTGNQCCSDGYTCPSAGNDFINVCKYAKREDCVAAPAAATDLVVRRFEAHGAASGNSQALALGLRVLSVAAVLGPASAAAIALARRLRQRRYGFLLADTACAALDTEQAGEERP